LAPLYLALVALRLAAYRVGLLRARRAAGPVISVGNLTVGGSGKTPLAEYLLREAARAGLRPALLSRGYGRRGRSHVARVRLEEGTLADPVALGDEPAMLARRNPAVPVYVGRNRFLCARAAAILDAPDLYVLDDGYHHLRLARDLNVLLIDAERGLGNGRMLPWGPLREPLSAIARADVVLLAKANLGDPEALLRRLGGLGVKAPVFRCDFLPARLVRLDGAATLPPAALAAVQVSLLCGIAQPRGFVRAVEGLGARVGTVVAHRDHYPYPAGDLPGLEARLAAAAPDRPEWVTTAKDAVKLAGRLAAADRLWVLEMEAVPEPAAREFFFDYLRRLKLKSS
jgi:tetraacyldisaccharide 4'-kinase